MLCLRYTILMSQKLTITDRLLVRTILPFVPQSVTPNMITTLRLFSIPFIFYFFWIEAYPIAFPLFFLSAFSDAIDGALARSRGLITNFGKLFDPLVDKLLIATAVLILVPRFINWPIAIAMVGIDLVLILNGYSQKRFYGKIIQAENSGKIKMIFQVSGLLALLLFAIWNEPFLLTITEYSFYSAIIFALVSLIVYRAV